MMADINITVEQDLKDQAEKVFSNVGLSITEALKLFLRESVEQRNIPFHIGEPNYNEETMLAIQEARDIMSGKVKVKSYATLEEMYRDLDSEDEEC